MSGIDPIAVVALLSAAFCVIAVFVFLGSVGARPVFERNVSVAAVETEIGPEISRIARSAFFLRLVLGLILLYGGYSAVMAPDSGYYAWCGETLAAIWSGRLPPEVMENHMTPGRSAFLLLNGVSAFLLGNPSLGMIVLTSLAGAWNVSLGARIALRLGDAVAARWAAYLLAFFPSLVLWSSLNIRDSFLILAVTGFVLGVLEIRTRFSLRKVLWISAWLVVMGLLRPYLLLFVTIAAIGPSILAPGANFGRNFVTGLVVSIVLLVGLQLAGFSQEALQGITFQDLNTLRAGFALGANSGYLQDVDISSVGNALRFLPLGIAYFLFAPFPWQIEGTLQMLTIPETIAWYGLSFWVFRGMPAALRRSKSEAWLVLGMAVAMTISYALVSGNVGTAYRHRAQVLPMFFALAAVGLSRRSAGADDEMAMQPARARGRA